MIKRALEYLADVETLLGHTFTSKKLLQEALTHPSCAETRGSASFNYQRLEFLGDGVLGVVIAELLFALYPKDSEGDLARRHAALVRGESLADVARKLGVGPFIRMTPSESNAGGRENPSNLEDVMEALIGALYLDAGFAPARAFIALHWRPLAEHASAAVKDAKTRLQEWAQARGLPLPIYSVTETEGPAHAPEFTVCVVVGEGRGLGRAFSKRQAEQLAATALLEQTEESP